MGPFNNVKSISHSIAVFSLTALSLVAFSGCAVKEVGKGRAVGSVLDYDLRRTPKSGVKVASPKPSEKPDPAEDSANLLLPLTSFASFSLHTGPINALAVGADGLKLYTGGEDGRVVLTTLTGPNPLASGSSEQLFQGPKPILALALSPDGKQLAIARFSVVFVVDLETHQLVASQDSLEGRISALSWDPRGEYLAIGRANGDVFLWGLAVASGPSANRLESYRGATSPIESIRFHPDGAVIFVAPQSGGINVWRLIRTERELGTRSDGQVGSRVLEGGKRVVIDSLAARLEDIWLSDDGSELFTAAADGQVYSWQVRGLVARSAVPVSSVNLYGLAGASKEARAALALNSSAELIAVSDRESRVSLLCGVAGLLQLFAQSPAFDQPLTQLLMSSEGSTLWGIQKTGNLVGFDLRLLAKLPNSKNTLDRCKG